MKNKQKEEPKKEPTIEEMKAKNEDAEPEPRFKGDPSHAHYLLQSGDIRSAVFYAAEHGYNNWAAENKADATGFILWPALSDLEQFGILSHVQSIAEDPHGETWLSIAPHNAEYKAFCALDAELRKALGYAEKFYA